MAILTTCISWLAFYNPNVGKRMMIRILKWAFAICMLLSLLYFVSTMDLQQVRHSLQAVGYKFTFLLLVTLCAYVLATIGWRYCIQTRLVRPSVFDLFLIRHIGEMVSLINPTSVIAGEGVKVHLLQNKGVAATTGLTSILISRLMMAVTQIMLLLFVTVKVVLENWKFFSNLPQLQHISISFSTQAILLTASLILFFTFRHITKSSRVSKLLQKIKGRLKLAEVWMQCRQFFQTSKKALFLCAMFFLLHWIAGALEVYFILKFLGFNASISDVIFVDMGIIIFKSIGVFVPGQIGVEELGNKVMLGLIGIPDDGVWITVSVLRRARQLFWICFGGAAYLFYYKHLNRLQDGNTLYQP